MAAERVCVLEKGPTGYGFHLHSVKNRPGQYIKLVEPGSPAERAGLKAGDRLVRVSGDDVRELSHQQVVGKIRAATDKLSMEVQGPEEDDARDASQVDKESSVFSNDKAQSISQKELRPRLCTMKKGASGYGFNLHSDKNHPGQYIRAVDPDSPAEEAGLLPKDRIIEVNGESMVGKQHGEVVSTIKAGGEETTLLVVDPETELYFQDCHVTPGREHLSGPLPDRVVNGGLEKEDKPEYEENESPRDSLVSNEEPEPLENPLKQEAQKENSDSAPVPAPVPAADPVPSIATLDLNMSLAVAKERAHQKRSQKKAPTMDWNKRKEVFSSL